MSTPSYRTYTGSAAETYHRCFVPAVAAAEARARAALERDVVNAWRPYVEQGRLRVRQPMVVATGRS